MIRPCQHTPPLRSMRRNFLCCSCLRRPSAPWMPRLRWVDGSQYVFGWADLGTGKTGLWRPCLISAKPGEAWIYGGQIDVGVNISVHTSTLIHPDKRSNGHALTSTLLTCCSRAECGLGREQTLHCSLRNGFLCVGALVESAE